MSVAQLSRASDIFHIYPHHVSRAVCLTRPQGPTVPVYQMQTQTTQPLPRYSQYTVRLMAPRVWRTLASATEALWPTFGNHQIYQLQPAETESAPNVIRLLSAETECPPKVPIYPHSAPKPKPKPKFGRPLILINYFRWKSNFNANSN